VSFSIGGVCCGAANGVLRCSVAVLRRRMPRRGVPCRIAALPFRVAETGAHKRALMAFWRPAPATRSGDPPRRPAPATCPGDPPRRPAPATRPGDRPRRPAPATGPGDPPRRPAPATRPGDPPRRPAPARVKNKIDTPRAPPVYSGMRRVMPGLGLASKQTRKRTDENSHPYNRTSSDRVRVLRE
jgi:hypothetical protein